MFADGHHFYQGCYCHLLLGASATWTSAPSSAVCAPVSDDDMNFKRSARQSGLQFRLAEGGFNTPDSSVRLRPQLPASNQSMNGSAVLEYI